MKKLLLAAVAAMPLFALPALAWENIPGNAQWTLYDDFTSYPPNICQVEGGNFGYWNLVADGSLGQNNRCVEVNISAGLVLDPAPGHSALILSNATEGGGVNNNFPSGNLYLKVAFAMHPPRAGAAATDTGFVVWKFSHTDAGDTFYWFKPTSAGWTLGKTVNGVSKDIVSGSTPKFQPRVQHAYYVYQEIGGKILIFFGGANKSGRAKITEVVDPSPLTNGRFGFGTINSTMAVLYVEAQQF